MSVLRDLTNVQSMLTVLIHLAHTSVTVAKVTKEMADSVLVRQLDDTWLRCGWNPNLSHHVAITTVADHGYGVMKSSDILSLWSWNLKFIGKEQDNLAITFSL